MKIYPKEQKPKENKQRVKVFCEHCGKQSVVKMHLSDFIDYVECPKCKKSGNLIIK